LRTSVPKTRDVFLSIGLLADDVMSGVCFAVCLMMSSADPMSRFCGSKLYWILGYNTSL